MFDIHKAISVKKDTRLLVCSSAFGVASAVTELAPRRLTRLEGERTSGAFWYIFSGNRRKPPQLPPVGATNRYRPSPSFSLNAASFGVAHLASMSVNRPWAYLVYP